MEGRREKPLQKRSKEMEFPPVQSVRKDWKGGWSYRTAWERYLNRALVFLKKTEVF